MDRDTIDPTALTGLYLFAILPVAIVWGFGLAGVVALASFLIDSPAGGTRLASPCRYRANRPSPRARSTASPRVWTSSFP
jgi:hypothetical protein